MNDVCHSNSSHGAAGSSIFMASFPLWWNRWGNRYRILQNFDCTFAPSRTPMTFVQLANSFSRVAQPPYPTPTQQPCTILLPRRCNCALAQWHRIADGCSVAACSLNRFRAFYPNSGQPNNSAPRKLVSLREHPWGSGGMCIDPFLKRLETVAHMLCHALWTRCKSLAWLSHLFFKELHVSVC